MRDKIKKTERFVFGLFTLALFMTWGTFVCIVRVLNIPTSYAEIVLNPIPSVISLGLYTAWLIWLGRQRNIRILRGTLFPTSMEAES